MGTYNPYLPQILGQELVPIRDENIVFNGTINNIERGYSFRTTESRTLETGRFYINEFPSAYAPYHTYTINIYPKGQENQSGPIQSVIIPCNNGGVTGNVTIVGNSLADAVASASDTKYLRVPFDASGVSGDSASFFFAVNQYANVLNGKRILGVNFLYSADQLDEGDLSDPAMQLGSFRMNLRPDAFVGLWDYPALFSGTNVTNLFNEGSRFNANEINRIALGDTNVFFNGTGTAVNTCMPWTYTALQKFEASNAARIFMWGNAVGTVAGGDAPVWALDYVALEVIYCEEKRIITGSTLFGFGSSTGRVDFNLGVNMITLRDLTGAASPVLSAGEYTVTLARSNTGDQILIGSTSSSVVLGPEASINAVREAYPLVSHPAIQVNIPAPPTPAVDGQVFTDTEVEILPQISLHTSSAPLVETQVYGRQAVAQVYGVTFAFQNVLDSGISSASYPQVRFYARRFGDTIVPLTLTSASFPSSIATISPDEFDDLDEVIDGWKEVTLTFDTPPTMGTGTNPTWYWSASGETSGNRWEILGAVAPALSGTPGNILNLAPSPNQLSSATYGQPVSGAAIMFTWMPGYAPPVGGPTGDATSDAVLMFSQDPVAVSGFGASVETQTLTGIGLDCDLDPAFIPTGIQYNRLTWDFVQGYAMVDLFERTVVSGWGSADSGQVWNLAGGSVGDYSVSGGVGIHNRTTSTNMYSTGSSGWYDSDIRVRFSLSSLTTSPNAYIVTRFTDDNNNYRYRASVSSTGAVTVRLLSTIGGSTNFLTAGVTTGLTLAAGEFLWIRARTQGEALMMKVWLDGTDEPEPWTAQGAESGLTSGQIGVRTDNGSGFQVMFDDFSAQNLSFESFEIQRMDTVTDWQTIMLATSSAVTGFNDYEARTLVASSYRIRAVGVYGFNGPWSSTVTSTIPSPGVLGTSIDSTSNVLIFTSNSSQQGSYNLAYAMGWEGEVSEDFNFPEAAGQMVQTMYGRDYVTVFRPTERGGTNFSRTLLVQAAAIDPETLEDFTSLRDMAWADVPFICVRDQEANRWFTNVMVPSGRVQRSRRLYLAPVTVAEVTDTPTPVDP